MAAGLLISLLAALLWAAQDARAAQHGEESCVGDLSFCAAGASKAGSAMLQTAHEKETQDKTTRKGEHDFAHHELAKKNRAKMVPLRSRLEALERQAGSLKKRIAALEGDVGLSNSEPREVREESSAFFPKNSDSDNYIEDDVGDDGQRQGVSALSHAMASDERDDGDNADGEADEPEASVLQSSEDISTIDDSIKDRVLALEADMSQLNSRTHLLEKEIMWSAGAPALIQAALGRGSGNDSGTGRSWRARIVALEEEGDALESRVTDLERKVSG